MDTLFHYQFAFESVAAMILVFVRMAGMLLLNPLLARRNVPAPVKAGLTLALTLLIAPGVDGAAVAAYSAVELLAAMMRELFLGFCCSFVFQIYYYLLFFTGDFMDVQFGLSMARVFDPGTSIQASVSGNFLTILYVLYVLATDSHLVMIHLFATSYELVPVGAAGVMTQEIAGFVLDLFVSVFSLALRLALPFVAAEFVLEMGMGVLMKLIPQIHVFVINIQFKVLLGFFLMLAFASPISGFLDQYTALTFTSMKNALAVLGGA